MRFQAEQSVNDVNPGAFEFLRPFDIVFLVKAGSRPVSDNSGEKRKRVVVMLPDGGERYLAGPMTDELTGTWAIEV